MGVAKDARQCCMELRRVMKNRMNLTEKSAMLANRGDEIIRKSERLIAKADAAIERARKVREEHRRGPHPTHIPAEKSRGD